MKNKPASLLVVPLEKVLNKITPSWCGRQMSGNSQASSSHSIRSSLAKKEDKFPVGSCMQSTRHGDPVEQKLAN